MKILVLQMLLSIYISSTCHYFLKWKLLLKPLVLLLWAKFRYNTLKCFLCYFPIKMRVLVNNQYNKELH